MPVGHTVKMKIEPALQFDAALLWRFLCGSPQQLNCDVGQILRFRLLKNLRRKGEGSTILQRWRGWATCNPRGEISEVIEVITNFDRAIVGG